MSTDSRKDAPAAVLSPTASGPSPCHFRASHRSGGTGDTVVRLSSKNDQKLSGSLPPPGNRHPIPTIAIGSAASVAPTFSRALRAIKASFMEETRFVCVSAWLICALQVGPQGLHLRSGPRLLRSLSQGRRTKEPLPEPVQRLVSARHVDWRTGSR